MKGRKAAGDLVKKSGFLNMILITPPENYKDSLYILFNDTGKMLFEKTLPDPVMKRPTF